MDLTCDDIKAYVPARDFALSCQFYKDMGFDVAWQTTEIAYFYNGECSFLLQHFYNEQHAKNFMMHLLVTDVAAWYSQLINSGLSKKYAIKITKPELKQWQLIEFNVYDPSGVLWNLGQEVNSE